MHAPKNQYSITYYYTSRSPLLDEHEANSIMVCKGEPARPLAHSPSTDCTT